jgi:hypothetical protein
VESRDGRRFERLSTVSVVVVADDDGRTRLRK